MIRPIHIDDELIVVSKPAGLLSVPGRGEDKQDCLAARVQSVWPEALIVHRLDQVTSGLMVFARTPHSQKALGEAFATRRIAKRYHAIVEGELLRATGSIDLPLICDWPNRPRQRVDHALGKPAVTHWSVLGLEGGNTRLVLMPVTGRTHQLRVHMQALGHPIAGDTLYGAAPGERVLLHAHRLGFEHPVSRALLTFEDATPF